MPIKKIKYLIIHCSATPENKNITAQTVKQWHTNPPPQGRGWSKVGYSDLILLDGKRHTFVKHNADLWLDSNEITNGVAGINSMSRHVCYIGGMDSEGKKIKNTLTENQNVTLSSIIAEVLTYAPDILIAGHNQFANKGCPSFYVPDYLRNECLYKVNEKNIYLNDPYNYSKQWKR
jgi:N-acetylmuramoyl-L-alanine amidase